MCYFSLTYDEYFILNVFYIKLSWNYVFLANFESVILWYFLTLFFEEVK